MSIHISNLMLNSNAPAGTVIGASIAYDATGAVTPCNFTLAKNSAGFLAISRSNLVTARASITAGTYSLRVHLVGPATAYKGSAAI